MTLSEAVEKYPVPFLDPKHLAGQEQAFETCVKFLAPIEKAPKVNPNAGTGRLKHLVEDPGGYPGCESRYNGYVYEGTFILAAFSLGFTVDPVPARLRSRLNISEKALRARMKLWGKGE